MFTWLKSLLASTLLKTEIAALLTRLTTASGALDNIEKAAIAIAKDAAPEVQALAQSVLSEVLSAEDKIRVKTEGFVHEWESKLYADYQTAKGDAGSVYQKAQALVEKTVLFFKSKL